MRVAEVEAGKLARLREETSQAQSLQGALYFTGYGLGAPGM